MQLCFLNVSNLTFYSLFGFISRTLYVDAVGSLNNGRKKVGQRL